mgnify:CR=1 FL=1
MIFNACDNGALCSRLAASRPCHTRSTMLGRQCCVQMQAFGPSVAFEHPYCSAYQLDQVCGYWLQGNVPRFDTGNVENIANQLKQADGR